jgi:hypothetical protein
MLRFALTLAAVLASSAHAENTIAVLLASLDLNIFKIGCFATLAAVRHLNGETLPQKAMLPAEVIDKKNYQA